MGNSIEALTGAGQGLRASEEVRGIFVGFGYCIVSEYSKSVCDLMRFCHVIGICKPTGSIW